VTAGPAFESPDERRPNALGEVRTVLWLQWRLLRNALRRGKARSVGHVVSLVVVSLLTLPYVVGGSIGVGYLLRTSPPDRVERILTVVFAFALMIWIASPASGQQLLENPNLPRLLMYPISLSGLVLGGVVTSALSLTAVFTIPFVLAAWIGSSRDAVSSIAIAASAVAMFAALVMIRTVTSDIFDLVAEDRRTRNRVTLLVVIPFMLFYFSQMGVQNLGRAESAPFRHVFDTGGPLSWLPPGWFAASVRAALTGDPRVWGIGSAALLALVAIGAVLHYQLQERLYLGDIVRTGPSRAGRRTTLRDRARLPGLSVTNSALLRALVVKDVKNLQRSPMTPRLAFMPLMFLVMSFFVTRNTGAPPLLAALGAGGVAAFSVTSLAINELAVLDHRGLGALLLSPVPRHLVLISHAIVDLGLAAIVGAGLGVGVALASGAPVALVVTPLTAVLAQVCFNGLAHVSSVFFPYFVDLDRGRSSANESTLLVAGLLMFGMPLVVAPPYLIVLVTWFVARAWVWLAVVGAFGYAVAVYGVLLAVATRGFPRREERLLTEIVEGR
jgi:hypothetical protein